jgi:hypothetical protein
MINYRSYTSVCLLVFLVLHNGRAAIPQEPQPLVLSSNQTLLTGNLSWIAGGVIRPSLHNRLPLYLSIQ